MTASRDYLEAIEAHNRAIREFEASRNDFRNRKIDAEEYSKAFLRYESATAIFDAAFNNEAERRTHE